jgi:ribosomal protein S17E
MNSFLIGKKSIKRTAKESLDGLKRALSSGFEPAKTRIRDVKLALSLG